LSLFQREIASSTFISNAPLADAPAEGKIFTDQDYPGPEACFLKA